MCLYHSYYFPSQHNISFLFNVHTYYCAYSRSLVAFSYVSSFAPFIVSCCILVSGLFTSHISESDFMLYLFLFSSLGSFLATWSLSLPFPFFFVYVCLFLSALCGLWDLRSQVQGLNPGPWQWKHWFLTTGPQGTPSLSLISSLLFFFACIVCFLRTRILKPLNILRFISDLSII